MVSCPVKFGSKDVGWVGVLVALLCYFAIFYSAKNSEKTVFAGNWFLVI